MNTKVITIIVIIMAVVNIASSEIEWVYIDEGYNIFKGWMSKYEITNAQYCNFLNEAKATNDIIINQDYVNGAKGSNQGEDFAGILYYRLSGPGTSGNGSTNGGAARINYSGGVFVVDSGFEDHPVTYVTWVGATAFCNYYGYRLPTELEWQAVADFDGTFVYGCGETINNNIANYSDSIHPDGTTSVGSFGAYGYGLCDMAGNVREWTSSTEEKNSYRICGGGWNNTEFGCRIAYRSHASWDISLFSLGFRVCFLDTNPSVEVNVKNITCITADLDIILDDGGETCNISYSIDSEYGNFMKGILHDKNSGLSTIPLVGLIPNTVYYYKVIASNSKGSTSENMESFSTHDVSEPVSIFSDPNTLLIQNNVKQFLTDPNNPHANQGILTYVKSSGNLNEIDSNDVIYLAPDNSSSKIVSLIQITDLKGKVIGYHRLVKDYRPSPIDKTDPNNDVLIELSIYKPVENELSIYSVNYLIFWIADNNSFKEEPLTIQQISTDPNIEFPVWDIKNIIKKNNRILLLDNILTYPNISPVDSNIPVKVIELNSPYAWFILSTSRNIIDINDDSIINLNDYMLLLEDVEKVGIFRSDIASIKNNKIVLGIPDGKVNETDENAFITEYNKLYPDDPIETEDIFEDFESGHIEEPFATSGDSPWIISTDSYKGNYSARSKNISHSQSSILEANIDVPEGNISFWIKVSSESGCDELIFHIDDIEQGRWSGELNWNEKNYQVTPGYHNLKWIYEKDFSVSSGEDAAWIDDIAVP